MKYFSTAALFSLLLFPSVAHTAAYENQQQQALDTHYLSVLDSARSNAEKADERLSQINDKLAMKAAEKYTPKIVQKDISVRVAHIATGFAEYQKVARAYYPVALHIIDPSNEQTIENYKILEDMTLDNVVFLSYLEDHLNIIEQLSTLKDAPKSNHSCYKEFNKFKKLTEASSLLVNDIAEKVKSAKSALTTQPTTKKRKHS